MAEQDAAIAIQNALQKLDQQPILLHNVKKLKSVKSKLHRFSSSLEKFHYSISELTELKEFAYDVEDFMDDAIMAAAAAEAAQKRWRMLRNLFLFFWRANTISQQLAEDQIEEIDKHTSSLGRSTFDDEQEDVVVDDEDMPGVPPQKNLFYLSLSGFPQDVEISARRLIQIWVAEGFLDPHGSLTMEKQGKEQIQWLLERGFITEVQRGTCGSLKTFKINEQKLQGCRSAAEEENFLHTKIISTGQFNGEISKLETTRLAIHHQSTSDLLSDKHLRSFANLFKVRSLQIHSVSSTEVVNGNTTDFGFLKPRKKEFESLRVLDLGCLALETVPEEIGKLAHLRYLRLTVPNGNKIPASICNLPNLQTIDLKTTKSVKTMPQEIWKMRKNLRHLHLSGATVLPPPRRANHYVALENLQTLCGVRPDKELKRLIVRAKFPNLTRLRLQTKKKDSQEEFLSLLNSLDHLYHLRSLTLRGPIEDLPSDWNAFPTSLTKMTLSRTRIPSLNCVKTLQNLPNLRYLKLMEESVSGSKMECDGGGFPALQVMRMLGLKELDTLRIEKGAMRLLRDLEVRECGLERVEAFQPSKELRKTLRNLQINHPRMAIEVDPESECVQQ